MPTQKKTQAKKSPGKASSKAPGKAQRILEAGGIVGRKVKTPADIPADDVSVRAYAHPALGDRPVVRLTTSALAPAVDLEMEALGCGPGEDRGVVGKKRRQTLGFPGWALVHDPKHARYALEVVKSFKKEARRARTKPGHAKEGIDSLAATLGRSVPHFLPSYYEEAGRAFMAAGNQQYAAQAFEKAREAERVHALEVDEDLRRDAFLEFALRGAVSIKSLSAYARELQKSRSPDSAYSHFRELCVRRTLGGMPPWAGMVKELRRLATEAKRDLAAEEETLLGEIIESPSLGKAPLGFWKSYIKPLKKLAADDPAMRGILLNLFPKVESEGFDAWWVKLLGDVGALEAVTAKEAESVPAEARPAGGAAAWLERLVKHLRRHWRDWSPPEALFGLVEGMAPRLKAEGVPVSFEGRWHNQDLDLCDYALELSIPLKDPDSEHSFDLGEWAKEAGEPQRGRDPVHLAADKRFAELLAKAIDDEAGSEPFETVARGKKGLAAAREAWLLGLINGVAQGGLPRVQRALEKLSNATSVHTFLEFPKAYEALCGLAVVPGLGRTLRAGIFDELGWEALDRAAEELTPAKGKKLSLGGTWPHMILSDGVKVIVVSPSERVLEHSLRIPQKAELEDLRYVDGELLVVYRASGKEPMGYWSGSATKKRSISGSSWYSLSVGQWAWQLPDGGVTEGGTALSVGDTKLEGQQQLLCDGETCWVPVWRDGEQKLRELDPRTGQLGRYSLPAWLEAFVSEGQRIQHASCELLPLPKGIAHSPLGAADGKVGWRVRRSGGDAVNDDVEHGSADGGQFECQAMDGRRWEGLVGNQRPSALLQLPGGEGTLPVVGRGWYDWDSTCHYDLYAPDGKHRACVVRQESLDYRLGSPVIAPRTYWHLYAYRDEAGSVALRKVPDETLGKLFEEAVKEWRGAEPDVRKNQRLEKTEAGVKKQLKGVTHPRLIRGVTGVLAVAAQCQLACEGLVTDRNPENAAALAEVAGLPEDEAVREAVPALAGGWGSGSFGSHVRGVSALCEKSEVALVDTSVGWWKVLGRLGGVAFASVAFGTSDEHRETQRGVLRTFLDTPFVDEPERLRIQEGELKADKLPFAPDEEDWEKAVAWWKESFYYVSQTSDYWNDDSFTVVEYAPDRDFRLLPGVKVTEERRLTAGRDSVYLRAFLEAAQEKGPLAWDPAVPERLAALTGLTPAEAALLWMGLPNLDSYDHHFLPKALREQVGLKATEANVARQSLQELDRQKIEEVFDATLPAQPADLWNPLGAGPEDPESPVARFGAAWVERFGRRVAVPPELVAELEAELKPSVRPVTVCGWLEAPAAAPELTRDAQWELTQNDDLVAKAKAEPYFTGEVLETCALYLPYLASFVPVGAPFRARLPELLELVRARLANKDLLLGGVGWSEYDYDEKKSKAFIESLPGKPYVPAGKKKKVKQTSRDTGTLVVMLNEYESVNMAFRPTRAGDFAEVMPFESDYWGAAMSHLVACKVMLSEGFGAHAARIRKTPVPEGGYETNPCLSVPKLVLEVGQHFDLDEDAACLYLQTLALAYPAKKLVQKWNDWKPARYTKAAKALLARELVVAAKRSRSSRAHFLPGGWEALTAPLKPLETWKMALYGLTREPGGGVKVPMGRILPPEPVHQIFAAAWARVKAGDSPEYEEVS